MEVLKASQCFTVVDGFPRFIHSKVVLSQDGQVYSGRSQQREPASKPLTADSVSDITLIPIEGFRPPISPSYTLAPNPLPTGCYIKRPNLLFYGEGVDLSKHVLRELEACEIIRTSPHPNVVRYLGALNVDRRVGGLCFPRFNGSLMSKVNPGHLSKTAFVLSGNRPKDAVRYLEGVEAGIQHLHSLGLIHNDINPANIMLDENDNPVIVDFDRSLPPGSKLIYPRRSYGWYDPDAQVSKESNDLEALEEIRTWLTGSSPDELQFTV